MCATIGSMELEPWAQHWLAEMNRRVLAGRPMGRRDLEMLEALYGLVNDRWGPPCLKPCLSLPALLAELRPNSPARTA